MSNGDEQIQQKEIAPGVILHKEYRDITDKPDIVGLFIWKVEVTTMSVVDFEVSLDRSENIELENSNDNKELKTVNKILPFETKEVARVILKNDWKLKTKFFLTTTIPEKTVQYSYIMKDDKALEKQIQDNYPKLIQIPFEHLSTEQIEQELNKLNIKFIDMDFLPNDDAVISSRYDESMKEYFDYIIHWRRPEDFIQAETNEDGKQEKELRVFNFNNEPEPNDIHQGLLADHHLASAFSSLAEKYNLIKRLFKSEKYSSYGIYQVKLCINGEWVTVVIDDLFPCMPLCPPLVSRCQSNELWILILEKAMAKVFDCYYNLTTTNIADFLLILTGCPTLYFNIEDLLKTEDKTALINRLKYNVVDKKYLTVAISRMNENEITEQNNSNANNANANNNINEDDMLTIPYFGYTIIDVKTKYKENLIVLRKVWYDESKEKAVQAYEENFIKENPMIENEISVGTLILKFDDFLKEFASFAVCYAKNWDEVRIRGKFVLLKEQDTSLEFTLSKWYYCIQLEKTTNIIISLHQDEDKSKDSESRKQLMDISLTILQQDSTRNEISHIQTLDFSHTSNIQIELNLPAGQYIILPRTTGCFFGRPIDKPNIQVTPLYNYEDKKFNPIFINTLKDIFKKFDLLLNRKLGYNEFKGFWECIKKDSIDEKTFKENILDKFQSHEDGLTERGFITFWQENFLSEDGEAKVRSWLNLLGYDAELYPLRSRCFMLTFHSDTPISVSVRDALNTDLNNKVNKIILKTLGDEIKKKGDITAIQYQSKNNNIVTVGCVNKGTVTYKVVMSFSECSNLIFSGRNNKIERIIQPGNYEFFLHFFAIVNEKGGENIDFSLDCFPLN